MVLINTEKSIIFFPNTKKHIYELRQPKSLLTDPHKQPLNSVNMVILSHSSIFLLKFGNQTEFKTSAWLKEC